VLALCVGLAAVGARADDNVAVPGGAGSIRRLLGLDPARPSDTLFLDLHEFLLFGVPENISWPDIEARRRTVAFIEDLIAWRGLFGNPASFTPSSGAGWNRCERALEWLGFRVIGNGPNFLAKRGTDPTSIRRQSFLNVLGMPMGAFLNALHAGQTVAIGAGEEPVPLPFGLAAWRETLSAPELGPGNAFLIFIKNVRASRMLVALHGLDPETRQELFALRRDARGRPTGWRILYEEALDTFFRYPEALLIRDGQFLLPGGTEAVPIWTNLLGVPPSERAAFLRALYKTDGGKAASVIDALQHLREDTARQLLLGHNEDRAGAIRRFRRLYRSIDPEGQNHSLTHRDPYDFAHLAAFLGRSPGNPFGSATGLVNSDDARKQTEVESLLPRQAGRPTGVAVQRRFVFLSNLLAEHPSLDDPSLAGPLEQGLDRFLPAYAIFEDLPFSRPELTLGYLATLDRLERREPTREAEVAAGLFEGDVELLARATRAGTLEPGEADALLAELLTVPVFARENASLASSEPALFAWLSHRLLPALHAGVRQDTIDADELIERAMAGPPAPTPVQWRGGRYRFDPAADEVSRQRAFREKQRLTWISELETLHRERAGLAEAVARGDLEAAKASAAELAWDLGLAGEEPGGNDDADTRRAKTDQRAWQAAAEIAAIPAAGGLSGVSDRLAAFDAALAERHLESLLGHVYAASAKDPNDLYYQDPLFVRRHSFRTFAPGGVAVRTAFTETTLVKGNGGGFRVAGSLFGMSEVLGLLHADQLSYQPDARAPNDSIRAAMVAPIWAMSAARLDDDSLEVVAASCQATHELAQALAPLPARERLAVWTALARDLIPRSRLALLADLEVAPGEDAASRFLSPSDLYRIGRRLSGATPEVSLPPVASARQARETMARLVSKYGEDGSRKRLAEFGPFAPAYAGRFRLADLDMPPYERLAAYRRPEILSERLYDLKIAVACRVAEARLPAAVLPIVLAAADDAMLSELKMAYPYEWGATTRAAAAFSSADLHRIIDEAIGAGRLMRDDSDPAQPGGS
jgi:hypothetical protein